MGKLYAIIAVALAVVFIVGFLSVFGIQTISADKQEYSSGEEVKIRFSDFSLHWSTCGGKSIQIFKQEASGWKMIQYQLLGYGGEACVDGETALMVMGCDFVLFPLFPTMNIESKDFSWNSKVYEKAGEVDSCFSPFRNETVNRKMENYELRNVPPGKYKLKYGSAETIIEIK